MFDHLVSPSKYKNIKRWICEKLFNGLKKCLIENSVLPIKRRQYQDNYMNTYPGNEDVKFTEECIMNWTLCSLTTLGKCGQSYF